MTPRGHHGKVDGNVSCQLELYFSTVLQILTSIATSDIIQPLNDAPVTLRGVDVDRVTLMDIGASLSKLQLDDEVNKFVDRRLTMLHGRRSLVSYLTVRLAFKI